jgi:hypothetical protein
MVNKWFKTEEPNELERFGYSTDKSEKERHDALDKSIISDRNSGLEVFHKLWGLANVTESTQKENSMIYRVDANYVKNKFYGTKYW